MNPIARILTDAPPPPGPDEWDEELAVDSNQAEIERRLHEMPERIGQLAREQNGQHRNNGDNDNGGENSGNGDGDDETLETQITALIAVIDLTATKRRKTGRNTSRTLRRNPPIQPPNKWISSYEYNGLELKEGVTVEIIPISHLFQASFLHIQTIIQTESGIELRGLPLTRTRYLRGKLPRLRNEVVFILQIDEDDQRSDEIQAAIQVPVRDVLKLRVFHVTNKNFPEHRFPPDVYKDITEIEEKGVLICRWKYRLVYQDTRTRESRKPPLEFIIAHINGNEVPKSRFRASESWRMNAWRGGKVRGGEFNPEERDFTTRVTVNVDELKDRNNIIEEPWIQKQPRQQYTFGDMFCGAGGASSGARSAGFRVRIGCDNAVGACRTYRNNFPEACLYEQDMYDFIQWIRNGSLRLDVLHLSPPCQFWSPAHTTPGVNDEANIAILFSCHELIKHIRPRIFTLEQTFGIMHPKFEHYFNALIHGFTQYNYSVRWKIVNLLQWGSPARRLRLIMMGACPGEELPPYPPPTHSDTKFNGTKLFRTVLKMLKMIPPDAEQYDDLHDPSEKKRINNLRWDPRTPLLRTITCTGGAGNYHFTGKRDFTLREYAMLQGFPVDYMFEKPQRKRQIGNAFPPLVVKTIYTFLREWLDQKDHVYSTGDELVDFEQDGIEDGAEVESEGYVEYLGEQIIVRQANIVEIDDSDVVLTVYDSEDSGELEAMSYDGRSPAVCIDAYQPRFRIDLTGPIQVD
ncbi:S-adenosyl-L-methionine-dependent methyltransferase [Xylariaceae sp. FL0662B]|nr:S-adenosyl-L-methionine-dependent methyltransferase [Xylariaceae sp. FL0662B]